MSDRAHPRCRQRRRGRGRRHGSRVSALRIRASGGASGRMVTALPSVRATTPVARREAATWRCLRGSRGVRRCRRSNALRRDAVRGSSACRGRASGTRAEWRRWWSAGRPAADRCRPARRRGQGVDRDLADGRPAAFTHPRPTGIDHDSPEPRLEAIGAAQPGQLAPGEQAPLLDDILASDSSSRIEMASRSRRSSRGLMSCSKASRSPACARPTRATSASAAGSPIAIAGTLIRSRAAHLDASRADWTSASSGSIG